MAEPKQRRRYPVFVGGVLAGWIWVWEPPALIDSKNAVGKFEPGPHFAPFRARFEEAMELCRELDAWGEDDQTGWSELNSRYVDRVSDIVDLGITVGDEQYPVEDLGLYDNWSMSLYPPADGFGTSRIDPSTVSEEIWNLSPIPSHLVDWVGPAEIEGDHVRAAVLCPCGNEGLEFLFTGIVEPPNGELVPKVVMKDENWFFRVEAMCRACGRDQVLFDNWCHGHEGFLYHNAEKSALPRPPLNRLHCSACTTTTHWGRVGIVADFKGRYFEEGYAKRFGFERWPDAFGCFGMSIVCCGCGQATPGWIDYEAR